MRGCKKGVHGHSVLPVDYGNDRVHRELGARNYAIKGNPKFWRLLRFVRIQI